MAARTKVQAASDLPGRLAGLDSDALIRAFRVMHMARRLDDREILLKRQSRIFFQISGAGHEAIQAAAGMALRAGHDWIYPYYRDRALCLMLGRQRRADAAGRRGRRRRDRRPAAARCRPTGALPQLHIVSASSPTGTQFLQAVGCADAGRRLTPKAMKSPW